MIIWLYWCKEFKYLMKTLQEPMIVRNIFFFFFFFVGGRGHFFLILIGNSPNPLKLLFFMEKQHP